LAVSSSSRQPFHGLSPTRLRSVLGSNLQQANHLLGRTAGFAFARYPTRLDAELNLLLEGFSVDHVDRAYCGEVAPAG